MHQTGGLQGPQGKIHQTGKEKNGRDENRVDHNAFADQVHEKAGDEETFHAGDDQREDDVVVMAEVDVGGEHRDDCADHQRGEHNQVAANFSFNVVSVT